MDILSVEQSNALTNYQFLKEHGYVLILFTKTKNIEEALNKIVGSWFTKLRINNYLPFDYVDLYYDWNVCYHTDTKQYLEGYNKARLHYLKYK